MNVCVCVCSLVAQPASQQALGLLTAPPLPVNHKNSSMCEWRVAVGTLPRELKEVWGLCACASMCAYLYQCLCMSESVCLSEPGCYYGDRSWKCPPTSHPPLLSFHKPLILGMWNTVFKAINYVCVVSIQSHQSDLIISLCSIPVTLHINCFPSTPFLFVFLFPFFFHLVHWCALLLSVSHI